MNDILKNIEKQFTHDISRHFNEQLEINLKNALFNLDIEFKYQHEFYSFVTQNVTRISKSDNPYIFQLYLNSGEYLLQYSYEPTFDLNNLENGRISATAGSIQIISRKTK